MVIRSDNKENLAHLSKVSDTAEQNRCTLGINSFRVLPPAQESLSFIHRKKLINFAIESFVMNSYSS